MAGELNFYGIYIPVILILALLAYAIYLLLVKALEKWQLNQWILLPTIFHLCLYIVVFGLLVSISSFMV